MKNQIDRELLHSALAREETEFERNHQKSKELHDKASKTMLAGVPMSWMMRLPGKWPIFVKSGHGARFQDVDGNSYVDFCLGDTGAMTGHAPPAVVKAATERLSAGHTFMLPVEDAIWVSEELGRWFGLPFWQMALTATDSNRFCLRLARQVTGRQKVLVFNYCYHGTVDETLITLGGVDGKTPGSRAGNIGPQVDPTVTSKVVEWNDVDALEAALAPGDVAAVLAEPAMTNIGIILPDDGFHARLREATRRTGTLLIIDETHTICAGIGGFTRRFKLEPDMITLGKPIAGGIPTSVYGMTADVAQKILEHARRDRDIIDCGGVGGTLAGNGLALAAMKATLTEVLTEENFERMEKLAIAWAAGVQGVIDKYRLPWIVQRLGSRAEYWFRETLPRNGGEAAHSSDPELEHMMHLAALNRGVLLTPFHSMALMCPDTTMADIEAHTKAFEESVKSIVGK